MERKQISKEEIETITQLQQSLRTASLGGDSTTAMNGELQDLIASGKVDMEVLGKAILMQKVLSATGLSPEDLGKALLMQQVSSWSN